MPIMASGSGKKVNDRKQAVATVLSDASQAETARTYM
jgi:hypothetical protein